MLYLSDAWMRSCTAVVTAVEETRIELDRTVLYATGGGQPHDTGALEESPVIEVTKDGGRIWHTLADGSAVPEVGQTVEVTLDWDRRYQLMRTHTAMHLLCGVMWQQFRVPVTGGNMEPLSGRLDFEFAEPPEGFKEALETALNAEVAADRPITVSFMPRADAVLDEELIRTKVSLVPESVTELRIVDIVGLDRQADGGTHVASTAEVGPITVGKVQSKGKGFRRVRLELQQHSA